MKITAVKLVIFLFILPVTSCIKREEFPIEPYIEYRGFAVRTTAEGKKIGIIHIYFRDGDGDIGLSSKDTLPPFHLQGDYYYNFFMHIYKKQSNNFILIDHPYVVRIPPVNPDDYPQSLEGDIYIDIDVEILKMVLPENIFKFDAYLYDRALHKSNTITSPVIELP